MQSNYVMQLNDILKPKTVQVTKINKLLPDTCIWNFETFWL